MGIPSFARFSPMLAVGCNTNDIGTSAPHGVPFLLPWDANNESVWRRAPRFGEERCGMAWEGL